MGGGASKIAVGGPRYQNSKPTVHADEVFGCFSSADNTGSIVSPPGFLYRLVNRFTQQWFFYNDTCNYDMVVLGYFGALNTIRALGNAKMYREMPSGLLIVTTVVGPLATVGYIEGAVRDGYDLQFGAVRRLPNGTSDTAAITALTSQQPLSQRSLAVSHVPSYNPPRDLQELQGLAGLEEHSVPYVPNARPAADERSTRAQTTNRNDDDGHTAVVFVN